MSYMSKAGPKKAPGGKLAKYTPKTVEPIPYVDFVKDKPDTKDDASKAYDWTKHYSYDPSGNTYIRSLPEDAEPDPNDVKPEYVTVCPECATEIAHDKRDATYKCQNCGNEFKV